MHYVIRLILQEGLEAGVVVGGEFRPSGQQIPLI
jgi:hypothetical protein